MNHKHIAECFKFLFVMLLLSACNEPKMVDFDVSFYVDGKEITSDTLAVPLNSFQIIKINTYAPVYNEGIFYTWRSINEPPMDLRGTDSLRIRYNEFGDGIRDGREGTFEWAEFYMSFSDSLFHHGDLYKLSVSAKMEEKVLNILVE